MTTKLPVTLVDPAGSTSGQSIVSTGPSTAPAWSNTVTMNGGSLDNAPIGATTPSTGAFTTLSATGLITPSQTAGVKGTTTNNNANAGSVGEYVSNSATSVSMVSGSYVNITSISLTAGDWDVSGSVQYTMGATTVWNYNVTGISTTSAANGGNFTYNQIAVSLGNGAGTGSTFSTPLVRLSLSATTTVYLVASANFTTSTLAGTGQIRARRIR